MGKHVITMLPGEGTGPEICEAVRRIIDHSGVDITWEYEDRKRRSQERKRSRMALRRRPKRAPRYWPAGTGPSRIFGGR